MNLEIYDIYIYIYNSFIEKQISMHSALSLTLYLEGPNFSSNVLTGTAIIMCSANIRLKIRHKCANETTHYAI